jgi:hypothetical protein
MATCTTEEVRITDSEIITWLGPYYFHLGKEHDIAYLTCVICLRDTLQIIEYVSEYDSKGSSTISKNQSTTVDEEAFDKKVLSLKNKENYLWIEGHKHSEKPSVVIFVEIPKDKAERRDAVAEIIRSSFSEIGYECTIG